MYINSSKHVYVWRSVLMTDDEQNSTGTAPALHSNTLYHLSSTFALLHAAHLHSPLHTILLPHAPHTQLHSLSSPPPTPTHTILSLYSTSHPASLYHLRLLGGKEGLVQWSVMMMGGCEEGRWELQVWWYLDNVYVVMMCRQWNDVEEGK